MNATLKRMFEDKDCSIEEAKLKAAILGKSYDECRQDWEREFKKEYILDNASIIERFSWTRIDCLNNQDKWYCKFTLVTRYVDNFYNNAICKCSGVEIEQVDMPQTIFGIRTVPEYITMYISFYKSELDQSFLHDVEEKASELCKPEGGC